MREYLVECEEEPLEVFKARSRRAAVKHFCELPEMKAFLDGKITVKFETERHTTRIVFRLPYGILIVYEVGEAYDVEE